MKVDPNQNKAMKTNGSLSIPSKTKEYPMLKPKQEQLVLKLQNSEEGVCIYPISEPFFLKMGSQSGSKQPVPAFLGKSVVKL